MLNFTIYENKNSSQWVTFVHGAGGSSIIWFKQIRDFRKQYNVLLLDLRGHGESKAPLKTAAKQEYTVAALANDMLEVLDFLDIKKTHFVGISLGTVLIRQLAEMYPERVQSMILGGATLKVNLRAKVLLQLGNLLKHVLPHVELYQFFAFVIMPKKKHRKSRGLFINETKKITHEEFINWYKLTNEIAQVLKRFREVELNIPTLYVMGEEDYMFLPAVREVVENHNKTSQLFVMANCGHVVNVEQPNVFNEKVISFINARLD